MLVEPSNETPEVHSGSGSFIGVHKGTYWNRLVFIFESARTPSEADKLVTSPGVSSKLPKPPAPPVKTEVTPAPQKSTMVIPPPPQVHKTYILITRKRQVKLPKKQPLLFHHLLRNTHYRHLPVLPQSSHHLPKNRLYRLLQVPEASRL